MQAIGSMLGNSKNYLTNVMSDMKGIVNPINNIGTTIPKIINKDYFENNYDKEHKKKAK